MYYTTKYFTLPCKFRILNSENETYSKLITEAINHPNLLEKNIKKEISKDLSSEYELINKINDKLYDDNPKEKSLESIKRICNKEDLNNKAKIERRKGLISTITWKTQKSKN